LDLSESNIARTSHEAHTEHYQVSKKKVHCTQDLVHDKIENSLKQVLFESFSNVMNSQRI
jgi:hypothetical protein